LEFDLDLARLASSENPVYYVQYAYARICSILRYAGREQEISEEDIQEAPLDRLTEPVEIDLIKKVLDFPEVVRGAAVGREIQRLPHYLREVAQSFHRFYEQCRVVSEDEGLTRARMVLAESARRAMGYTLGLMGVSAPEKM
jgi:arginyl-tRNA synthetase